MESFTEEQRAMKNHNYGQNKINELVSIQDKQMPKSVFSCQYCLYIDIESSFQMCHTFLLIIIQQIQQIQQMIMSKSKQMIILLWFVWIIVWNMCFEKSRYQTNSFGVNLKGSKYCWWCCGVCMCLFVCLLCVFSLSRGIRLNFDFDLLKTMNGQQQNHGTKSNKQIEKPQQTHFRLNKFACAKCVYKQMTNRFDEA